MRGIGNESGGAVSVPVYRLAVPYTHKDIVKAIPGVRWEPNERSWLGTEDTFPIVGALTDRPQIRLSPRPHASVTLRRAYQSEGVNFLASHPRAILGDDMGLGKTYQALHAWEVSGRALAAAAVDSKLLVICPNYCRQTWCRELSYWTGVAPDQVFLPRGRTPAGWPEQYQSGQPNQSPRVVIVHYDILDAWCDMLREKFGPSHVILDEVHLAGKESTLRGKACREICEGAAYVWGLSGTPLTNHMRNLWQTLDLIAPGAFGNWHRFGVRYCGAHQKLVTPTKPVWVYPDHTNVEELSARLKYYLIRRTKAEVQLELPAKTRQVIEASEDGGGVRAGGGKFLTVKGLLSEHFFNPTAKVVIFTHHVKEAHVYSDLAQSMGFESHAIVGGVSDAKRNEILATFAASDQPAVLACTVDSCGTGIDLSAADVCIFAELMYEPHKLLQAESRLHRYGQKRPVLIQYVIDQLSTDAVILEKVINRLDAFEAVIGATGDTLQSDLGMSYEDAVADITAAIAAAKQFSSQSK